MIETLVSSIINMFGNFGTTEIGKSVIVFVISLMPILELRGGLIAASILKLNPYLSYIICVIGNLLPIPFIIIFLTSIFEKMKKLKIFKKIIEKLEKKALSKKDILDKGEFIGLILFVGIPLPGTGAWTGALIASVIGMDKKKAMLAITLGIILASIIMMIISFGFIGSILLA